MYRIYLDGDICFQGQNQQDAYGYWTYAHNHFIGRFLSMVGPGKDGENTVLHEANLAKKRKAS